MNPTAEAVLDALEKAQLQHHEAFMAGIQFCRTLLDDPKVRDEDGDDWLRMPIHPARCPISGWSRSTLNHRISDKSVRRKTIGNRMSYYSGADVRKVLTAS